MEREEETLVLIVGAGPAGLAISACLTLKSIPFVILEREDCCASLWKKRAYDRCHLHLAKEFCSLPFKPHAPKAKKYMPKDDFIQYIDDYVSSFNIKPRYCNSVESASFDRAIEKWRVQVKNTVSDESKVYISTFLIIATGENGKGFVPDVPGLKHFKGEILHSNQYKSPLEYHDKEVLVVGCGNSGMEIAYDLSSHGATTSIVIRNPVHVVTREIICVAMHLLKYLRVSVVDTLVTLACKLKYGDLSKYGIHRPKKGPFFLKMLTGRSPVIDVGTIAQIKAGKIQVLPAISRINENNIVFDDGFESRFDAIIFATGYRNNVREWLKDYDYILNDEGLLKNRFPNHWKGKNKLYCAGLSRMGLLGVSRDAIAITDDIEKVLQSEFTN